MAQDPGEVGARRVSADDEEKTPEQLRSEIEDTREGLGDTVEALAAKTDVKARARDKADELKRTATTKKDDLLAKAKRATSGDDGSATPDDGVAAGEAGGSGGGAAAVVQQLKDTAQRNPVQAAAAGAFLGGLLIGRQLGRR